MNKPRFSLGDKVICISEDSFAGEVTKISDTVEQKLVSNPLRFSGYRHSIDAYFEYKIEDEANGVLEGIKEEDLCHFFSDGTWLERIDKDTHLGVYYLITGYTPEGYTVSVYDKNGNLFNHSCPKPHNTFDDNFITHNECPFAEKPKYKVGDWLERQPKSEILYNYYKITGVDEDGYECEPCLANGFRREEVFNDFNYFDKGFILHKESPFAKKPSIPKFKAGDWIKNKNDSSSYAYHEIVGITNNDYHYFTYTKDGEKSDNINQWGILCMDNNHVLCEKPPFQETPKYKAGDRFCRQNPVNKLHNIIEVMGTRDYLGYNYYIVMPLDKPISGDFNHKLPENTLDSEFIKLND